MLPKTYTVRLAMQETGLVSKRRDSVLEVIVYAESRDQALTKAVRWATETVSGLEVGATIEVRGGDAD